MTSRFSWTIFWSIIGGIPSLGIIFLAILAVFRKSNLDNLRAELNEAKILLEIHTLRIQHLSEEKAAQDLIMSEQKLTISDQSNEIKRLRDLVTLNAVPPALASFVNEVASKNHEALVRLEAALTTSLKEQAKILSRIEGSLSSLRS